MYVLSICRTVGTLFENDIFYDRLYHLIYQGKRGLQEKSVKKQRI